VQAGVRAPGGQLLAWDCKYEYTRTPVGKRWHESTSISTPEWNVLNTKTCAGHFENKHVKINQKAL